MNQGSAIAEQRIVLKNISWQLFENFVNELGIKRCQRLAYYNGQLEIMNPLWQYESTTRLIDQLIMILAQRAGVDILPIGAVTLKRPSMKLGKEPASSYYVKNEAKVRSKGDIDLKTLPPDLCLEVDFSGSELNQLMIYADLDVPEVWRYDGEIMGFFELNHGTYIPVKKSPSFPDLEPQMVADYLQTCKTDGVLTAIEQLKAYKDHW